MVTRREHVIAHRSGNVVTCMCMCGSVFVCVFIVLSESNHWIVSHFCDAAAAVAGAHRCALIRRQM